MNITRQLISMAIEAGKKLLFVDMDGTLAAFYRRPEWADEMTSKAFFVSLEAYQTTVCCLRRLMKMGWEIFILSAALTEEACDGKREWLTQYTPFIAEDHWILMPCGINKAEYLGVTINKECYLLDDYDKNLNEWSSAGGTPIKFRNEVNYKGLIGGSLWSGLMVEWSDTLMADHIIAAVSDDKTDKCCFLIVGPSGSGKTTVVEALAKEGYKTVESYTDRPRRYEGETGHIFLSKEEFDNLPPLCAYTMFSGNRYGVTEEIVDACDTYVIDVYGIKYLREKYKGKRRLVVIGLSAPEDEVRLRMTKRGDKIEKVEERILHDRTAFRDMDKVCDYVIPAVEAYTTTNTVRAIMEFHNSHVSITPEEAIRFYHKVERGEI